MSFFKSVIMVYNGIYTQVIMCHQAYFVQMGNVLTATQWFHGRVAGSLFGMRPGNVCIIHALSYNRRHAHKGRA